MMIDYRFKMRDDKEMGFMISVNEFLILNR